MPCLEIIMPEITQEKRETLSKNLTEAFADATGFPADIFGIHFQEYRRGEVALGGKLWKGEEGRPYIHLVLYCPRLRREVKQKLVEGLTKQFIESIEKTDWKPVIHLCEHPYDNVGVDGKLLSDAYEECAGSEFYYPLPQD